MNDKGHMRFRALLVFGILLVATLLIAIIWGYGKIKIASERHNREARTTILVATEPCAYLVERVVGDRACVEALAPKGKSPETFAPQPAQIERLVDSKLFFTVGLPIEERFLKNVGELAPDVKIVDLTAGIEPLQSEDRDHDGDVDPHIWTSPANAMIMVEQIADSLVELDPEGADAYRQNADALLAELTALQASTREKLAPYENRFFVVFHPAYGYFAREFHLRQLAVEVDGKSPRPKDLEALVEQAKSEDGVDAVIVQPEFDRAAAQVVADAIGANVIVHSPLEKDYFANIEALTNAILTSFGASKESE